MSSQHVKCHLRGREWDVTRGVGNRRGFCIELVHVFVEQQSTYHQCLILNSKCPKAMLTHFKRNMVTYYDTSLSLMTVAEQNKNRR